VTPEAVVLEFDSAGLGSRTAAAAVDLTIQVIVGLIVATLGVILDFGFGGSAGWVAVTFFTFVAFFFGVAYPAVFETLWQGRTPGKAMFGLRVVTDEGAPITFRHAAIRAATGLFELLGSSGVIAAFAIFFTKRNQRLGDLVAGTLVLRERTAARAPVATAFRPLPGTEDYAATLDVSVLTSDEYLAIRAFLLKASQMNNESRRKIGEQLARQFVERLRTQPPGWMSPEVFLVCAAAAYQRRFSVG